MVIKEWGAAIIFPCGCPSKRLNVTSSSFIFLPKRMQPSNCILKYHDTGVKTECLLCLNLRMNLENLIFYSRFAINGFISLESLVYSCLISTLIPDSEHSFLSPFGIRRASWSSVLLFYFRKRIYLVVFLLEAYRDDNSFWCWQEWFLRHSSAVPDY